MEAEAAELTGGELDRGIAIFSRRFQAIGARAWEVVDHDGGVGPAVERPTGTGAPAPLRLYRATASEHYVLDPAAPVDTRTPVIV